MEVQMKSRPIILSGLFVFMLVVAAEAQIPRTLSYQGVLTDSLGNPKPDGTYTFTFRLYESISGGSAIWTEQKTLQVGRGLFHTVLGDQVVIGPSVAFDRPYWLSIQIASEPELTPRIPLTAVAYSITSVKADTAQYALNAPLQSVVDSARVAGNIPNNVVTTPKIADGAVTSVKIGSGQVVKRLNGVTDAVTLSAQGGATITSSNDTIIINAGSGGGGTGVQGIQNTNNTLDVINPNGPTVTVNVKNSGITATQLADNAVTSTKIADGTIATIDLTDNAVTTGKILNGTISFADIGQNSAANGQVMKWNGAMWMAARDSSGGPFVPLGGGTMTGGLAVDFGNDGNVDAQVIPGAGLTSANLRLSDGGNLKSYLYGDDYGTLQLYDINNSSSAILDATDDLGGTLTLHQEDGTSGVVLRGGSTTNGATLSMRDSSGSLAISLDADIGGNSSVVLPLGAISSSEIFNEPGVASRTSDVRVNLSGGVEALLSRSITVPSSGYVLVIASAEVELIHSDAEPTIGKFGVSDQADTFPPNQDCEVNVGTLAPGGNYRPSVTAHGLFSVSAGTSTFYFLGQEDWPSIAVGNIQLTLIYFPTAYGTVTPTTAAAGKPDLDGADERSESTAFQLARVEEELAQLKAERSELEARLKKLEARIGERGKGPLR